MKMTSVIDWFFSIHLSNVEYSKTTPSLLLTLRFLGAIYLVVMANALKLEKAAVCAMIRSIDIVWAFLLQVIVFGDAPSLSMLCGAGLIGASVVLLSAQKLSEARSVSKVHRNTGPSSAVALPNLHSNSWGTSNSHLRLTNMHCKMGILRQEVLFFVLLRFLMPCLEFGCNRKWMCYFTGRFLCDFCCCVVCNDSAATYASICTLNIVGRFGSLWKCVHFVFYIIIVIVTAIPIGTKPLVPGGKQCRRHPRERSIDCRSERNTQ